MAPQSFRPQVKFPSDPLDDYERLDATLDYAVTPRAGVYLRMENLLGEEYEELRGFTTPGATAVLGLRASGGS